MPTLLLPSDRALTAWTVPAASHFHWWFDPSANKLYSRNTDHVVRQYIQMEYEGHVISVGGQNTTIDITSLQICTVRPFPLCENSFTIQGDTEFPMDHTIPINRAPTTFSTFQEFLQHAMKDEPWVYANLTVVGDIDDIPHALGCGTIRAVSNGSCDYDKGIRTAGWCIIGGKTALRGVTQVSPW